jgi:CubicO group peptidase (beta-lactamase class C family)
MRALTLSASVAVIIATGAFVSPPVVDAQSPVLTRMEQYLESLRRHVGIPGMSGAIVINGRIAWERGMGLADVASATPAAPDTLYHIGELTQVFTSVMLLQCVERGTLSLDELVQSYKSSAPANATIRHALSHTAGVVPPGSRFEYDAGQLPRLSGVVDVCMRRDHRLALGDLLMQSAMYDSVPGPEWSSPLATLASGAGNAAGRYQQSLSRLATPYRVDRPGAAAPTSVAIRELDGGRGLLSTARDLAEFSASLDRQIPLSSNALSLMWSPFVTTSGQASPTALGWFTQSFNGNRVVWQFGTLPDAGAALMVVVPERRLTLVLLANSDRLNAPYVLSEGDVTRSPFARTFLSFFL